MSTSAGIKVYEGAVINDVSGTSNSTSTSSNPYDALIESCEKRNDTPYDSSSPSVQANIQAAYTKHRMTRNAEQASGLLSHEFEGMTLDPILSDLLDPLWPEYVDPRNSIVFWARPPGHILELAQVLGERLKEVFPDIWLMPPQNMHTTVLEIFHSKPNTAISPVLEQLSRDLTSIVSHPTTHLCRLIKPMLSFDSAAVALSFVPAATAEDTYTYHHLRRDLFSMVRESGAEVASRYVVPSAHITLARFVGSGAWGREMRREDVGRWVEAIEDINKELSNSTETWDMKNQLVCRVGRLWYGGGITVAGEGVEWKGLGKEEWLKM